jgi:hypothetical protein
MSRILAIVLLIQVLAQTSGLAYAVLELGCQDGSSEESHEDCSPGCDDCLCCPQHRILVGQPATDMTVLAGAKLVFPAPISPVATGLPRDIMHVPKTEATA